MANTKVKSAGKQPIYKSKRNIIIAIVGVLVVLFILIGVFGAPSAKSVFSDMQETMLKTQTVTLDQTYNLTSSSSGDVTLKSIASMSLMSAKDLTANGNFKLDISYSGTPLAMDADYILLAGSKYVRFNALSSDDETMTEGITALESKLHGNWIKARDDDSYTSFISVPVNTLTNVLPIPFANLTDSQSKVVLNILRDESTYTILESSKVEINDVSAYKYSLNFSEAQYARVKKAIAGYQSFFDGTSESKSEIKTLNVWVNIRTKRLIKMEFSGTSDQGNTSGTILFSDYNKALTVTKPDNYSIESELTN
jgi:hypothetical protein